jgi:hypothetical protein
VLVLAILQILASITFLIYCIVGFFGVEKAQKVNTGLAREAIFRMLIAAAVLCLCFGLRLAFVAMNFTTDKSVPFGIYCVWGMMVPEFLGSAVIIVLISWSWIAGYLQKRKGQEDFRRSISEIESPLVPERYSV